MGYVVDWPNAEYHEILPNLFLGGHAWLEDGQFKHGKHSKIQEDKSWGYVVSAYLDEENKNALPRCDMRMVLFEDTKKGLSEDVWEQIRSAVDEVVRRWQVGDKVLVRCQAGYNRSGMLMSLILMRLGFTAEKAIERVRLRRGLSTLVNSVFEGYVHEREGEYFDSDALEATEALVSFLSFC